MRTLLIAALLAVSGACDRIPTACTDELRVKVRPAERTLRVGESFTAEAIGVTCGGRRSSPYPAAWRSSDLEVARVDSPTGRVTAVAPGSAAVSAHEPTVSADWGYGAVQVRVVPR